MSAIEKINELVGSARIHSNADDKGTVEKLYDQLPKRGALLERRFFIAEADTFPDMDALLREEPTSKTKAGGFTFVTYEQGRADTAFVHGFKVTDIAGSFDFIRYEAFDREFEVCRPNDIAFFSAAEAKEMLEGLEITRLKEGDVIPRAFEGRSIGFDLGRFGKKVEVVASTHGFLLKEKGGRKNAAVDLTVLHYGLLFGATDFKYLPQDHLLARARPKADAVAQPYGVVQEPVALKLLDDKRELAPGTIIVPKPDSSAGYRIWAPHMIKAIYEEVPLDEALKPIPSRPQRRLDS